MTVKIKTPQLLTYDKVKKAAKAAFEKGLLTAQHPIPSNRECVYTQGKYHCAVGAAFDERTKRRIRDGVNGACNDMPIVKLIDDLGIIKVSSQKDAEQIIRLQKLHDTWARFARSCSLSVDAAKQHFVNALNAQA